jgi:type II secretory pathway pseudopilin PulG
VRNVFSIPGYSLLELLFATGLMTTLAGMALPVMLAGLDEARTLGGVRYVSARLQRARMDAVARSANTAVRFVRTGASYAFGVYVDGNGDGVRTFDIQRGVDTAMLPDERLPDQFPGVEFGTLPNLPPVDSSTSAPGVDPIKLGSSDMLAFTPLGTSSSGSLYVLGPRRVQFVIRVFGATGKVRILRFDARSGQWVAP